MDFAILISYHLLKWVQKSRHPSSGGKGEQLSLGTWSVFISSSQILFKNCHGGC